MPWHDRQLVTATIVLLCAAMGCSKHVESNADKAAGAPSSAVPADLKTDPKTNPSTEAANVTQPSGRKPWVRVAEIDSIQRYPTGTPPNSYSPANPDDISNPNVVSFLNDDRLLIADLKYGIRIFNTVSGKQIARFGTPLPDVRVGESHRRVFASLDGRLAMILPDPEPKIWRTDKGTCVGVLPWSDGRYLFAAFYPDGKRFATLREGLFNYAPPINLHLWELSDGPPQELAAGRASVRGTSLLYCAPYVLVDGPVLTVHDPNTLSHVKDGWPAKGNVRLLWSQPQTDSSPAQIGTMRLSTGQAKADATDPVTIDVISLADGRTLTSFVCPRDKFENRLKQSYQVSPDHDVIAISNAGPVEFLQLDGWKRLWALDPYPSNHAQVTFLPRSRVALSDVDTPFRIYDYRAGRIVTEIPGLRNKSDDAYSPSGNCVAVHGSSSPVRSGAITTGFEKIEIWRQRDSD